MGYAGLLPEDPHTIGSYRLLGWLGSGGMGKVFLGMSADGRPVAIKVIRADLAQDPKSRVRFRREVAAARKVSGLFTALVVDADLDGPTPWLATAYVAGPSLTQAVRDHGPLPVRTLLALTTGLADCLSAIHAAGMVHRDLKPSNVLLAEDGPRVIDFGISQAAGASAVTASTLFGSPAFMSPEQVLGEDIGPPSDMFSLGAVLTFAATGQGPFGSGSAAALMGRVVINNPANLSDVPEKLRQLIGSCLAKHPGDRPTAPELLAAAGGIQPSPGWLAQSILVGFVLDPAAAPLAPEGAGNVLAPAGLGPGRPHHRPRPGCRRISRPLASVCVFSGLVAAFAVGVFALTGANRPASAAHNQPQVGARTATAPAPASAEPSSRGPSSSAKPSAAIAPNAYLAPSLSNLSLSPSFLPTLNTISSLTAVSGQSSAQGSSPSASASPTKSLSPSPSRSSPSPSASISTSSSPSASTSPSSSASAAGSPSSSSAAGSPSSSPTSATSASASTSST